MAVSADCLPFTSERLFASPSSANADCSHLSDHCNRGGHASAAPLDSAAAATASAAAAAAAASPSSWSLSTSSVVKVGSGLSATAVGMHLAAYGYSPWLSAVDFSLLLRLDLAGTFDLLSLSDAAARLLLVPSLAPDAQRTHVVSFLVLLAAASLLLVLPTVAWALPSVGGALMSVPALLRSLMALIWRRAAQSLLWSSTTGACSPPPGVGATAAAAAAAPSARAMSAAVASAIASVAESLKALRPILQQLLTTAFLRSVAAAASAPVCLMPGLSMEAESNEQEDVGGTSELQRPHRDLLHSDPTTDARLVQSRSDAEVVGSRMPDMMIVREPEGVSATLDGERAVMDGSASCCARECEEAEEGAAVTVDELEELLQRLERRGEDSDGPWDMVIDKASMSVDYCAWRRDLKDGPTEYMACTRFYNCSARTLAAFYLDSEHLARTDPLVKSFEQISFNPRQALELGRYVKKYPFCSPREYVLAWRLWRQQTAPAAADGGEEAYYCITKAVDHDGVPRVSKPRRVDVYKSAWRIRQVEVAGQVCAEVDMFLKEDNGMPRALAKIAFSRSVWGYIQTTDCQLRKYAKGDVLLPACVEHAKQIPFRLRRRYNIMAEDGHAAVRTNSADGWDIEDDILAGQGSALVEAPGSIISVPRSLASSEKKLTVQLASTEHRRQRQYQPQALRVTSSEEARQTTSLRSSRALQSQPQLGSQGSPPAVAAAAAVATAAAAAAAGVATAVVGLGGFAATRGCAGFVVKIVLACAVRSIVKGAVEPGSEGRALRRQESKRRLEEGELVGMRGGRNRRRFLAWH